MTERYHFQYPRVGHCYIYDRTEGMSAENTFDGSVWDSKANKTRANRWRRSGPPKGVGYQLWEAVSEGSPISPVCETPEALAHWLADNKASSFGDSTASYETWLNMIVGPGWAPSAVMVGGVMMSGVEASNLPE